MAIILLAGRAAPAELDAALVACRTGDKLEMLQLACARSPMRNFFVEAEQWRAQSERHTVAIGKLKETNAQWAGCLPELVRVLSGSQEVEQQAAVAGITPEWLRSTHGAKSNR